MSRRFVHALRRPGAALVGLALAFFGLVTVFAPTPARAAPVTFPYSCTTTFASGLVYTDDHTTTVENHSTTPGVAQLTVSGDSGDVARGALVHSYTGATYWDIPNATMTWHGVRSPETSFRWNVYPTTDVLTFTTEAFAAPDTGLPGVMEWDFVADATVPPSPGPGYDSGHTTCTPAPELTVTMTHVGDFVTGDYASWSIVVTNNSPWPTNGTTVTVSDILPAEVATWIGARGHYPVGWSGNLDDMVYTRSDVLGPGQSYPPILLTVEIPGSLTYPVTNTATLRGGGDQTPADDTTTDLWTFRGYASRYTHEESAWVDRVATFLGGVSREDAQRTGAMFLAFLDGILEAQHQPPPNFGSSWPWDGYHQTKITSQYSDDENAVVLRTAARFNSDVPTLQARGVLLIAFLIALSPPA